jgi:type VI secretion system protein ImpG
MQSYREYFEAEMRSLQDLAQEFAEAYPEQASMLNLNTVKDRDPYVERLLEGMAFLTSQIRHRLDDSIPEISQALLEQVMPALIRPYPSNTVVEYLSSVQQKKTIDIEAEQGVRAQDIGPLNAICDFTTTHPVTIYPVRISHLGNHEKLGGGSVIEITLSRNEQVNWVDIGMSFLKFYANTDWQLAYSLIHALTDVGANISISIPGRLTAISQSGHAFKLTHLNPQDSMLPYTGRSRSAFSVMHDYFCAREKYLFVELTGLENVALPDTAEQITIRIDTPVSLPVDTQLSVNHLKLNCTPAVNLYRDDAEPISVDHTRSEYRVNPERQCAEYSSIYSVEVVNSRDQNTGETYDYSPLYAMRHRKQNDRVFFASQRVAGLDNRITYLALNATPPFHPETVSAEVLLTNNQYPRRYVDIGSINILNGPISNRVGVKNITRPSKTLTPPAYQDLQWQLISLLSLNLNSLESVENIKHLLSLFDWTDQVENRQKIDALSGIKTRTTHRLKRGVLFQGLEIRVELNESGFSSKSDMYLFGVVIHHFFSAFASMTEFVQTRVVQLPSYKEWAWNPVFGSKTLF